MGFWGFGVLGFWAVFGRFKVQQMKCVHKRIKESIKKSHFWSFLAVFEEKKCCKSRHLPVFHGTLQGQLSTMQKECRNMLKMAIFGDFGLFLAFFGRFLTFLTKKKC